jgi:hypothetical protein
MLLLERYHAMEEGLLRSTLLRPLKISSQESIEHLSSDLFATVEYDMATINSAAIGPERWCEVMLLLSNSKSCEAKSDKNSDTLNVIISSSKTADYSGATPTEFKLQVHSATEDYLDVALVAHEGPLGTKNISLRLQVIPLTGLR